MLLRESVGRNIESSNDNSEKVRDEKLQYKIKRVAAKISGLLSEKIDKNEYLTDEEIFSPQQHRLKEQAKFTIGKCKYINHK